MTRAGFATIDADGEVREDPSFGIASIVADSPLTVRYDLADGIRWSDGVPIDAADLMLAWAASSNALSTPDLDLDELRGADGALALPAATVWFDAAAPGGLVHATEAPARDDWARSIDVPFAQAVPDWRTALEVAVPAHVLGERVFGVTDPMEAKQRVLDAIDRADPLALSTLAAAWSSELTIDPAALDAGARISSGPYRLESVQRRPGRARRERRVRRRAAARDRADRARVDRRRRRGARRAHRRRRRRRDDPAHRRRSRRDPRPRPRRRDAHRRPGTARAGSCCCAPTARRCSPSTRAARSCTRSTGAASPRRRSARRPPTPRASTPCSSAPAPASTSTRSRTPASRRRSAAPTRSAPPRSATRSASPPAPSCACATTAPTRSRPRRCRRSPSRPRSRAGPCATAASTTSRPGSRRTTGMPCCGSSPRRRTRRRSPTAGPPAASPRVANPAREALLGEALATAEQDALEMTLLEIEASLVADAVVLPIARARAADDQRRRHPGRRAPAGRRIPDLERLGVGASRRPDPTRSSSSCRRSRPRIGTRQPNSPGNVAYAHG